MSKSSNLPEPLKIIGIAILAAALAGCSGAEARKAQFLERGNEYVAERNLEKARIEFNNALQIDPKDANARFAAGQVAERLNAPRDALGHYQAALDENSAHVGARAALGRLYLLAGAADKALEIAEVGLAADDQSAALLTVRGAALLRQGQEQAALRDAERAVKLAPEDSYAVALLASIYRRANRGDDAIDVLRSGIELQPMLADLRIILADLYLDRGDRTVAADQLMAVVQIEPGSLAHRQRLAQFHLLGKDIAGAELAVRDAIKAMPENLDAKLALVELLATHRSKSAAEQELEGMLRANPANPELQLATARFYESRDELARAQAIYRQVADQQELRPAGLTARTRQAALLLQAGQSAEATSLIETVLAENARDNEALVLRSELAIARGDAAAAVTDLRAVLRDQPSAVGVRRALARAHLQNSEPSLAEETLRSAMQDHPTDSGVRFDLATLLAQQSKFDQALPFLQQLSLDAPQNLAAKELLLRVQVGHKDLAGALATADAMKRLRPDLHVGAYFSGEVLEAQGKPVTARSEYEAAYKLDPQATEPLTALVRLDRSEGHPQRAITRLNAAIASHPENATARNLKAELLLAENQFAAAVADFQVAIKLKPLWWIPYRGLALAQLGQRDTDQAIATLRQGIESAGGMALTGDLATLFERLNRSDDAIAVYEGALQKRRGSAMLSNNLAMLLASHRTDTASLERAAELAESLRSHTEPAYLNTRGWVKYKRGEIQESLPLLSRAASSGGASATMHYHLGMAQFRIGDAQAAARSLELALRRGVRFLGYEEAQQTLALAQAKVKG